MVGYLHPYPDGNGRIARFLMNAMLASGGYPWTVIRVEDRPKPNAGGGNRTHMGFLPGDFKFVLMFCV